MLSLVPPPDRTDHGARLSLDSLMVGLSSALHNTKASTRMSRGSRGSRLSARGANSNFQWLRGDSLAALRACRSLAQARRKSRHVLHFWPAAIWKPTGGVESWTHAGAIAGRPSSSMRRPQGFCCSTTHICGISHRNSLD